MTPSSTPPPMAFSNGKHIGGQLRSVSGVGNGVLHTLPGERPELGKRSHKQSAALCALVPFNRDSGRWRAKRRIRGGRANLRTRLYMATL
ncbi:MAG: transposase [Gammaproteobacteria bacterium]|nr:transposase [Gammaproteobacteria bacterium]